MDGVIAPQRAVRFDLCGHLIVEPLFMVRNLMGHAFGALRCADGCAGF